MMNILSNSETKLRVSSVLNRDVKQFGKKHLLDGEEDTCWNSDQGSPQWIHVELESLSEIEEIRIRFQGGFAGKDCWVEYTDENNTTHKVLEFYPDDVNSLQSFKFTALLPLKSFKIVFNTSTDFFGRITIYELKIVGFIK